MDTLDSVQGFLGLDAPIQARLLALAATAAGVAPPCLSTLADEASVLAAAEESARWGTAEEYGPYWGLTGAEQTALQGRWASVQGALDMVEGVMDAQARFTRASQEWEGLEGLRAVAERQHEGFRSLHPDLYEGTPVSPLVPAGTVREGRGVTERPGRTIRGETVVGELPEGFRRTPTVRTHTRRLWLERMEAEAALAKVLEFPGKASDRARWIVWERNTATESALSNLHICRPGSKKALASLWDVKERHERQQRAVLYSIALGIDAEARLVKGLRCWFTTVTLPGEWHRDPTWKGMPKKKRAWLKARHEWNGKSAKEAAAHLNDAIHDARQNARHHGDFVGLGVREAHEDGTPHAHEIVYASQEGIEAYMRSLQARGFEGTLATGRSSWKDGKRFGCERPNQCRVKEWLPEPEGTMRRGEDGVLRPASQNPATYLYKYLTKTTGLGASADRDWARTVGFRRYGFFGLRPGTVTFWKAAYRCVTVDPEAEDKAAALEEARRAVPEALLAAHDAIHARQYGEALALAGAWETRAAFGERVTNLYRHHVSGSGETDWRWCGFRFAGDRREYLETPQWEILPSREVEREKKAKEEGNPTDSASTTDFQLLSVSQGDPASGRVPASPLAGPRRDTASVQAPGARPPPEIRWTEADTERFLAQKAA